MSEEMRKAFEFWLNEPDQNYKDQASIYWSAFAAGGKENKKSFMTLLSSPECVEAMAKAINETLWTMPVSKYNADQAQAAIAAIKRMMEGV